MGVENKSKEQEQQDHKWKCNLCEKKYDCKDELKTHEKEHGESNKSKPKGDNIEKDRKEQEINSKCSHCNREFNNLKDFKMHENKCHYCKQCNNWYDNREDLESHRERRHKGYTCDQCGYDGSTNKKELDDHIRKWHAEYNCNQCENSYRLQGDLENHIKKAHSKDCEITPELRIEKQNYESKCDLCKRQFKTRNQLIKHWEEDHETHIYICIHLECRTKYICQESWKEHMKKNHGIGLNCPQCNEFYFFEEQLEEHLEEHIEREEYIELNEFQCVECHEFFPRDEAIKHENEGECDQCSKWLGCGKKVQIHKLEEHKTINEKVNMDLQESKNIIIEKDNISNEINTKEKQVTERLKIRSDTQERNNRTTNIQVQNSNKKNNRKNQNMVTIKEVENNKKEQTLLENIRVETLKYLKKVPSEPFTNIEEEHQKWDKDITNRLDKLKTIKDTPIGKNKATHKFFQYHNPKDRNNLVNITLEQRHKKENSYKPNTKKYITKER